MEVLQVAKGSPSFSQSHVLDGAVYVLSFTWNMRAGWFMGLADATGEVIYGQRRLVLDADLLRTARHDPRCPPGKLIALDLGGLGEPPGYEDLCSGPSLQDPQGRVLLVYVPEAEL